MELPRPSVVVLCGPSGAGKSTWAAARFARDEVVSADRLRGMVGEAEDDLAASADAFTVLDAIVEARLARGLTAVVDALGLDPAFRRAQLERAARHGVPAVAVVFETPAQTCRAWNRGRPRPLPGDVLAAQLRRHRDARAAIDGEGFARVVRVDPSADAEQPAPGARQVAHADSAEWRARGLAFGLHVSRFDWAGGAAMLAERLRRIGAEAEEAGFSSIWCMDHLRQIPQVGRPYEDLPEPFSTLGFLAGVTRRARLGALVAGITYRSVQQLGRIVATLDVLSGGRAVCGLGAAWAAEEHADLGLPFPALPDRYALLADALELLPLLWGPGAPAYAGRVLQVPAAACYPRPLQERVPILVGGSGERRTLRLVAERADGCNLRGAPDAVRAKLAVLHRHCAAVGRDPAAIEVTHLSTALAAATPDAVAELAARLRPGRTPPSRYAAASGAATVDEHVRRFAALRAAGVQTAIVRLADLGRDDGAIERFAPVIAAFT